MAAVDFQAVVAVVPQAVVVADPQAVVAAAAARCQLQDREHLFSLNRGIH